MTCGFRLLLSVSIFLLVSGSALSPRFLGQTSSDEPAVIMGIARTSIADGTSLTPEAYPSGQVLIGIVAFLSPNGKLLDPLCSSDDHSNCKLVERAFLSHPRTYRSVSEGPPFSVTSVTSELGECYETTTRGRTAGGTPTTGVVTSNPAMFDQVQHGLLVSNQERTETQARIEQLVREKSPDLPVPSITRTEKLRLTASGDLYLITEGRNARGSNYSMFFGIWSISGSSYTLVESNEETGYQESENFIGTIRLKHGKSDLIVTSTSDAEGFHYRVYGLRDGSFKRIYVGGGATC